MQSEARERVWDALLLEYTSNGGWPVTVREIADRLGMSTNTIHYHLKRLTDAGMLEHRGEYQRGWRPVREVAADA